MKLKTKLALILLGFFILFGLMAFVFFGSLTGVAVWRDNLILKYFFGFLSIIGFAVLLMPGPLTPVYNGWLKTTHLIGRVVTFTILSLAYYLVITPSALIKGIFGGRPLPIKPDANISTYWVTRTEPAQPKERFFKRF